MMTVAELRERLSWYPDDTPVMIEHVHNGNYGRQLVYARDEDTSAVRYCMNTSHNNDPDAVGQIRRCWNPSCTLARDAFRIG